MVDPIWMLRIKTLVAFTPVVATEPRVSAGPCLQASLLKGHHCAVEAAALQALAPILGAGPGFFWPAPVLVCFLKRVMACFLILTQWTRGIFQESQSF